MLPPRKYVLLWPPCVFVSSRWQGSSNDIICSCIIIQATDSPQGSPAETKPLSIYLSPSAWHFLSPVQGCCVCQSVTPVMDEFEHNLRLAARSRIFCGFRVCHCPVIPSVGSTGMHPSVTQMGSTAMKKQMFLTLKNSERFNKNICQAIWAV